MIIQHWTMALITFGIITSKTGVITQAHPCASIQSAQTICK